MTPAAQIVARSVARVMALASLAWITVPVVQASDPTQVLRMGMTTTVIQQASANDARATARVWAQGIAEMLGLSGGAEVEVYDSVDEGRNALTSNGLQLFALATTEFLAIEKQLPCRPAMAYEEAGEVMHQYVLVTRDRGATLAVAAGKSLAVYAPNQQASLSLVWGDTRVREAGIRTGLAAFAQVREHPKKGQAAMAVFFGKADFGIESRAALTTAIELNPQMGRELVVIETSPTLLPGIVCLSTLMPQELGRRYVAEATRLHQQIRYKQAFIVMRVTRIVEFQPAMLESSRALVARQKALASKR